MYILTLTLTCFVVVSQCVARFAVTCNGGAVTVTDLIAASTVEATVSRQRSYYIIISDHINDNIADSVTGYLDRILLN